MTAALVGAALVSCRSREVPVAATPDAPTAEARVEAPVAVHPVPGFVRELRGLDVIVADGSRATLETLVTRPEGPGPFPLVVISHGSPRDPKDRAGVAPMNFSDQSMVFARRGYAAAVVVRPGFGRSGGRFTEGAGPCKDRDYVRAGATSGADLLGAVEALRREPWVLRDRVLLVGMSAGGVASLSAVARRASGIAGVISFAGGHGSDAPDHVCQEGRLVAELGALGEKTRVPSLWIYAENDHFFGPALARRMFDAYRAAGGPAELAMAPAHGEDGHLFFTAGARLWWPFVEGYLAAAGLPTAVVTPAVPASIEPPGFASFMPRARAGFAEYLANEGFEKAFAIGEGSWGWASGRRTREEAEEHALANCAKRATGPCRVVADGDALTP